MGLGRDYINDHMYELTREKENKMSTERQKPQNVGSAYVNVKKGAPQELVDQVKQAVEFLRESRAYLSISMRKSTGDGFVNMTGFFNDYKREDHKDPDVLIRLSTISYGGDNAEQRPAQKSYGNNGYKKSYSNKTSYPPKKSFAKSHEKKQENDEQFGGEEVPFL